MGVAFEMVRVALGLADQGYIRNEIIAKHIIELAKTGEPRKTGLRGWAERTRSAPGDRQGVGGASPLR
jgi:hypothetical protein